MNHRILTSIGIVLVSLGIVVLNASFVQNSMASGSMEAEMSSNIDVITFIKKFGGKNDEDAYSLVQLPNNEYIVCGFTQSFGSNNGQAYVVKLSENGEIMWSNLYGRGYFADVFTSLTPTADSGLALFGWAHPGGLMHNCPYMVKIDSEGYEEWSFDFPGDGRGQEIIEIENAYLTCGTSNIFSTYPTAFLAKVATDGSILWKEEYDYDGIGTFGQSVIENEDGDFIACGHIQYSYELVVFKTDAEGNQLWMRPYQYNYDAVFPANILELPDNNGYIIMGNLYYASKIFVLSIDADGNEQWFKTFNPYGQQIGSKIKPTSDGGYIVSGSSIKPFIIKFDSNFDIEWDRQYDSSDDCSNNDVIQTNDKGFAMCMTTFPPGTPTDIKVIKTDKYGNVRH